MTKSENDGRQGHTPGPWLSEKNRTSGEYAIWTRQPHIGTLAMVLTEDVNGEFPAEANAHLIAAAPELLDALQFYMAICGNTGAMVDREGAQEAWKMAVAAIAKVVCAA